MDRDTLEKTLLDIAKSNVNELSDMIEFFIGISGGKREFIEMQSNLKLARKLGDKLITNYTYVYFLRFKNKILKRKVEYLFNFDYTSLIEQGTASDTDNLIRSIIAGIKSIWLTGDANTKLKIQNYILKLLGFSIQYDAIRTKIQA